MRYRVTIAMVIESSSSHEALNKALTSKDVELDQIEVINLGPADDLKYEYPPLLGVEM